MTNGAASVAVAAVVAVGLGIDDSVVTRVEARTTGIWLPVESTGELVLIDPASGVATSRIQVTEPNTPVEVLDTNSLVGVVVRSTGTLVTVDPALGVVSGLAPLAVSDVTDLVLAGDAWVVGSSGVARVPLDGSQPDLIELSGPSSSAAASVDGVALVIDGSRVDVDGSGAAGVDSRSSRLAVTNVGDQVATVDLASGSVRLDDGKSSCLPDEASRETVWGGSVTGPRVVVGADGPAGALLVTELDNVRCHSLELVEEPATFSQPLVVDEVAYVVNTRTGRLHIVDLASDSQRTVVLFRAGERVELIFHQGDVIAHEPRTFRGAVVGPGGLRRLIDKSAGQPLVSGGSGDSSLVVGGGEDAAIADASSEPDDSASDGFSDDQIIDDPVVLGADEVPEEVEEVEELVANFAYSAARVQVGVPVVFVDDSTGNPRSWTWDFGDGTNASGLSVEHAWSEPGTYLVTLFVDREDASDFLSAFIEVVSEETILPPTADFTFSDVIVAVDEPVLFTDVTIGEVTERRWDFGDGSGADEAEVSKSWSAAGSYIVTLTVANDAGPDNASATITVLDQLIPPTAVIIAERVEVDVGEPIRLQSASTGSISRIRWDFGDGGFETSSQVIHTYLLEGSYTVTLTVSNSAGSSETSIEITVRSTTLPPEARIAALSPIIESGLPTTLASISINNPDTLDWEFGDGSIGSGTPVTHTWTTAGTYVVTLTATNESGSDSAVVVVVVLPYLPPPIASFVPPDSIRVGTPAEFINTSSNGTTHVWDFGDGSTATTFAAVHTYSTPGTMVVSLIVTNRNGEATAIKTVNVLPALPLAGFTSSPAAVRVNQTVFFTNTSTGAATYLWDFGDGATSTVASPSHAYAASSNYPVTLTVTNAIGETDSFGATISVDPAAPKLGPITAAPTPGITLSVKFSVTAAVGSGPINSYTWDFGDGEVAGTPGGPSSRVTHTYAVADSYTVKVTAAGPLLGDVAVATVLFTVNDPPPPIIKLLIDPLMPELNQDTTLTAIKAIDSGPISSYAWDFGDGTFDTGIVVTHAWTSVGSKTVTLTAFGPVIPVAVSATVVVVPPPPPVIATASATPSPALTGEVVSFTAALGAASGTDVSWQWDFGDSTTSIPQPHPTSGASHTYSLPSPPGGYTVKVTATGPVTSAIYTFSLVVSIPPPILTTPTYTPIVALVGDDVMFSVGQAGSGPIESYLWTFHDSTSTDQNPTKVYPLAGAYPVTVSATGPGGTYGPISLTVTVYDPITADFSVSQPGGAGLPVLFVDLSTGLPAVTWLWAFGDGGDSSDQNPDHSYASPGIYSISLTVTDGVSGSDMKSMSFEVF